MVVIDKRVFILLGFFLIISSLSFADMNVVQFVNITTNQPLNYANGTYLGWCNITDTDNSPMYIRYIWWKNGVNVNSGQTTATFSTSPALLHNFANLSSYYTEAWHTVVQTNYQTDAVNLNGAEMVEAYNGYAYVVSYGASSLTTYNISNPAVPVQLNVYTNTTSINGAWGIKAVDGVLYVISYTGNSLTVFNISNPANPVQVNYIADGTDLTTPQGIVERNGFLYISTYSSKLTVYNISNLANPVKVSTYTNATSINQARDLAINGQYLYITGFAGKSLTTFNLSNPAVPVQIDYYNNATSLNGALGIAIKDNYAYVSSNTGASITVFNLTNIIPTQIYYYTNATSLGGAWDMDINPYSNTAYVMGSTGNSLTSFNITNPASPVQLSYYTNATSLGGVRFADILNGFLYASSYTGKSLTTFNISTISQLTLNAGDNLTLSCSGNDSIHSFVSAYGNSSQITIENYDTTLPVVSFVSPTITSGTILYANSIGINATATDTHFKNITINLYNSTGSLINTSTATTSNLYATFGGLTNGTYYFNATAYDVVDNRGISETRNFQVIYPPPPIVFTPPTPNTGEYTTSTSIKMNATSVSPNLANISLYLYNATGLYSWAYSLTSPAYYDFTPLPDGLYYFNATAFNTTGGAESTETRVRVIDTINPIVQFVAPTSPNGHTQITTDTTINVSSTDTNIKNTTIRFYNSFMALLGSYTSNSSNIAVQLTGLTVGTYYYDAIAYDLAGNSGTVAIRNITVESPSLGTIRIDDYTGGLTKNVELKIYVLATDNITYCDIRTHNYIDEDSFYWAQHYNTNEINQTVVFEKTDNYRVRLYCAGVSGAYAETSLVSVKGQEVIPDWLVWACLLGSVLLLLYAIKSENLFFGIFASLGFLVFVKLSEGAFITEIESLVPVFFWIKVVFAISLVLLIAQQFLKQAKSEIS